MSALSISLIFTDIVIIAGLAVLAIGPNRSWHACKKYLFRLAK